jgi:hypothetical protein
MAWGNQAGCCCDPAPPTHCATFCIGSPPQSWLAKLVTFDPASPCVSCADINNQYGYSFILDFVGINQESCGGVGSRPLSCRWAYVFPDGAPCDIQVIELLIYTSPLVPGNDVQVELRVCGDGWTYSVSKSHTAVTKIVCNTTFQLGGASGGGANRCAIGAVEVEPYAG